MTPAAIAIIDAALTDVEAGRVDDAAAQRAGDAERARARGVLLKPALALELEQVVVHGGGRSEADRFGDLADRRRVALVVDALADEFEDPLGSLLILFRHTSTIPNGCSHVKSRA